MQGCGDNSARQRTKIVNCAALAVSREFFPFRQDNKTVCAAQDIFVSQHIITTEKRFFDFNFPAMAAP